MRGRSRLPLQEIAPYLLSVPLLPSAAPVVLDWRQVFGNDRAVELEVGFGKGLFLLTAALAHPDVNFIGVEIVRKYQLFTATRLAKRKLSNVRVACADARLFLPACLATASLQAVHVYFPDPWWKKRHHKRRVFTAEFVSECARILRPDGQLYAVTDVPEYAQRMTELLAEASELHPLPPPQMHEPTHDLDYLTNFERKFRQQGKTIHRLCYKRSEILC